MRFRSKFRSILGFAMGAASLAVMFFPKKTKKLFRFLKEASPIIKKADDVLADRKHCSKCGRECDPVAAYCEWCGAEL